nr:MAG TPA: large terminase [Caudoviricetes sp.]
MIMATNNVKKTDKELANDKAQRVMNGVNIWCSYYRANPHRFCADYLNINLKLFQKILLFMMFWSNYLCYIASRGQGKTFLIAIFACCRCILYPDTQICVCAKARSQSINVLEKITTILIPNSANLRLEIKDYSTKGQDAYIEFRNGSRIKVVTANDNARSNRSNIIIIDEFRMVDLDIINKVIRKFNTAPRQPKYLNNPEYAHLAERNKEFYLSSAWFKSHWSYEKVKAYCANLVNDEKRYFVCGLPYQLAIKENLLSAEQVADEMSESDFNELSWRMEMETEWVGDDEGALFAYDDVAKNRKLKTAVYPPNFILGISDKKVKIPELAHNEKRIMSVDVALLASTKHDNDAAAIFINSALPNYENKYISNIIYTENHEGLHSDDLALMVRRLFDQYHCTDLVLDTRGVGISIYDTLCRDIYDNELGITYPALSCCNDPIMADRCVDKNAPKVIWAINATAQLNNDMTLLLREQFRQGRINLLVSEFEAEEILQGYRGYSSLSANEKAKMILPYINTTLLINELINLQSEIKGVNVKVKERSGMRKDRFSSLQYNIYVTMLLEQKLVRIKKPCSLSSLPSCVSAIDF